MPLSELQETPHSNQKSQTSWGSREDGDEHNTFRLQEKPPRSQSMATPLGPDLPKTMRHHRFAQARRLAISSSEKHEFIGCGITANIVYPKATQPPIH